MPSGNDADPPEESNRRLKLPKDGYSTGGSSSSDAPPDSGGTSSSSSSSSSSGTDEDDDVAPTTASPDAPVKESALKDLGSKGSLSAARAKLEATRFQDDMKVGKFYMQDGNPQGAYLRYKDAVDHVPDDPDARFALAQAADKLNKRDEAIANYQQALDIDPGGDHDKASRAALKRLGVTPK
jgi:tetratricopeptide (TPR) repeat protein